MDPRFDLVVDRRHTMSLKYDTAKAHQKPEDCLPLWVADMDFQTAPEILEALQKRVAHGIFGYSETTGEYEQAVIQWWKKHYQFSIDPAWIKQTPSIVFSIATAICAFTLPGDYVLVQQPVYHPFRKMIEANGRVLLSNDLILKNGSCAMDLEDLEAKIRIHHVKLFLLCNPHNPMGRVWTKEELRPVGEICKRYGVIVLSDEIHCDFVWPGHTHTMLLQAMPELANQVITCVSPSKTFNLAGLQAANNIIVDPFLRERFWTERLRSGYDEQNVMGLVAAQAAYEQGEEWFQDMKAYVYENLCFFQRELERRMPVVKLAMPEATYLLWLDFRDTSLSAHQINRKLLTEAKLWLNDGRMFGPGGEGFFRLNAACPRSILEEALRRLESVFGTK